MKNILIVLGVLVAGGAAYFFLSGKKVPTATGPAVETKSGRGHF
jgi:hypothetical protein